MTTRVGSPTNFAPGLIAGATADCLEGETAIDGGYDYLYGINRNLEIFQDVLVDVAAPPGPDRHTISGTNRGSETLSLEVYVVCAS